MNFNAIFDPEELQTTTHGWVFNFSISSHILNLRVGDAAVTLEERRQVPACNKATLIDRGC
jgi:hypothetical protein